MRAGALGRMPILSAEVDRIEALMSPAMGQSPAVIAIQMDRTMHALAAILAIVRVQQIALPLSPGDANC